MKQKECKDCWVAKIHHRIVKEIFEDINSYEDKRGNLILDEEDIEELKKKWLK